jgi:hypothetical protein
VTHATGPAFFYVAARFEAIQPSLLRVSDYRALLAILDRGLRAHPERLIAYCALPGHWELVVGPTTPLAARTFTQWVIDTHSSHRRARRSATPAIYASPVLVERLSSPGALIQVCRSVERRAMQAGFVHQAQDWPWSSLSERFRLLKRLPLVSSPFLTSNWWVSHVNSPMVKSSGVSQHVPQPPRRLTRTAEGPDERVGVARRAHENQADAHVERPEHFGLRHVARRLQPREERRNRPASTVE